MRPSPDRPLPDQATTPRAAMDRVVIGRVKGLHGVHGEFKVWLFNPASGLVGGTFPAVLEGPDGRIRSVQLHLRPGAGKRILGSAPEVGDREEAARLDGWEIVVDRRVLPEPGEGEWYQHDLLGLPVRTESGQALGRIAEIHDTAEVDVWVLRGQGPERVLPALRRLLREVRLRQGDQPGEVVVADEVAELVPQRA